MMNNSDLPPNTFAAHLAADEDLHDELLQLAEDIVRYCPSLTQLLLAMGTPNDNPIYGAN
jgi:hypothetical protein